VITCLSVGADGATVVTGSADTTLVIWALYGSAGVTSGSVASPRPLHVLCGHRGRVLCAALSTQMDIVISGAALEESVRTCADEDSGNAEEEGGGKTDRGSCAVWRAYDGQFVRWLPVAGTPREVAVSHVGNGLLVYSDTVFGPGPQLEVFSINGIPLKRVTLGASLRQLICTRDGEIAVASEGASVTVRRLHDLHLLARADDLRDQRNAFGEESSSELPTVAQPPPSPTAAPPRICALSLCAENHHTFIGTEDGGLCILANPIVNIQVLEAIAGELLNL
jgi:hypothetical protein